MRAEEKLNAWIIDMVDECEREAGKVGRPGETKTQWGKLQRQVWRSLMLQCMKKCYKKGVDDAYEGLPINPDNGNAYLNVAKAIAKNKAKYENYEVPE